MSDFDATAFESALTAAGLALPPEDLPSVRQKVLDGAAAEGADLCDAGELKRRADELWGFREAARHLECSWRTVQKWAHEGVLPTLPPDEWCKGPVIVFRNHYKKTPVGPEFTHTTEEVRIVDLVFRAEDIKAIDQTTLPGRKKAGDE